MKNLNSVTTGESCSESRPMIPGEEPDTGADPSKEVAAVILHTNDIHCGYADNIGYDGLALYKKELEQHVEHVFLVDCGDAIQGAAIGTVSKGQAILQMMNAAGYDVTTLGNHAFDFGMDVLEETAGRFVGKVICANYCTADGRPVFPPGIILDAGRVRIGFIGVDTPDSYLKSRLREMRDESGRPLYDFLADADGSRLCLALQESVDELRRNGADVIILLSHLGDNERVSPQYRTSRVLAGLSGIDAVLDGHSHQIYLKTLKDKEGKEILTVQAGTRLENIGQLTIFKDGHLEETLLQEIPASDTLPMETVERNGKTRFVDPEMHALINEIVQPYEATLNRKIGTLSFDMILEVDELHISQRYQENALCELVADAYRRAGNSEIGFITASGLMNDLLKGDITWRSILGVQPFGNTIQTVRVSGQMLKDILEYAVRKCPNKAGTFPHVSGMTFTVDLSVKSSVRMGDMEQFSGVEGPRRVSEIRVGGRALDPQAEYTLTTSDYLINGGDGFEPFKKAVLVSDTGKLDCDVVMDYIENDLGGVIPDCYRNPLGRMRLIGR